MEKTAIIYARVSTVRQAEDGLPVESQIEQCRAKAATLGARVLKVFRDDGISGRSVKRPGMASAFDFCEERRVDFFICWSTSRFARNRIDAALHKRLLDKMGVRLAYASQDFGEGDDGWLSEAITEVIDEQYSRQIAKDTRRSMAKNAADGFWNGGHSPFGFSVVPVGKRKRLAPDPLEVPTVRLIFQWCMLGSGCKEIAVRLNHTGVSKRGKRWSKASVASVLKCRAAIGQLVYRVGENEVVTNAHEAIIGEEDFMRVQELVKGRTPRNVGGRPRSEAILSGMLRCGECGDAMTTETATGRGGVRYRYYNCRSFLKGVGCRSRRVPVSALDDFVLQGILEKVFTPQNLRSLVLDVKQSVSSWVKDHDARLVVMYNEVSDIDSRIRRLFDAVECGKVVVLADIFQRVRELKARKLVVQGEIDAAEAQVAPTVSLSEMEVEKAAETFRSLVIDCEDPKRVRAFLSGIVRRAVILGRQLTVEYYPDRIVNPKNGSQCEYVWLPDLTTLRTVCFSLPARFERRLAA